MVSGRCACFCLCLDVTVEWFPCPSWSVPITEGLFALVTSCEVTSTWERTPRPGPQGPATCWVRAAVFLLSSLVQAIAPGFPVQTPNLVPQLWLCPLLICPPHYSQSDLSERNVGSSQLTSLMAPPLLPGEKPDLLTEPTGPRFLFQFNTPLHSLPCFSLTPFLHKLPEVRNLVCIIILSLSRRTRRDAVIHC